MACFGNVLRGDDGFGAAVAERLSSAGAPEGVEVLEIGIGGIHLVHALDGTVGGLIVVDAVELGERPGAVAVLRPDIEDVTALPPSARRDRLADMHYATPARALMLASALGVLPEATLLVGCQPAEVDWLGTGLTDEVAEAVEVAAAEVRRIVGDLTGTAWH